MVDQAMIPCPICSEALRLTVCTNRNGKHSIGLHCPNDGRHFRGFVNHRPFVEAALTRMADAEEARQATADAGAPGDQALQNDSVGPAPTSVTKKTGRTA